MTKIRFYLKNQHSSRRPTSIFMTISYGDFLIRNHKKCYQPLKYYIGESIIPSHWNKKANRARKMKQYPQYVLLNQRLSEVETIIHSLILEFKNSDTKLDNNNLRDIIDERLKKKPINCEQVEKKSKLFAFIEMFITEVEHTRAAATILQYKNTLRLLNHYAGVVHPIDFQDIDLKFYAGFHQYMLQAGYSETYFGNQIKFIRLFMNEAVERGYTTNTCYKSRKFASLQPQTKKIYLTEQEIGRIQNLKLGDRKNLEKSRDMFIIACKTGLRFSDLMRLKPVNFLEKDKLLCVHTQKTGAVVHIPLSGDVLAICKKYDYCLPPVTNVTFNTHIRKIGKLAGLFDMVEMDSPGGVPKYQLITAHTARRSFATNAFLAKVPTLAIMKITGHATEQAFMKYIRISGEDNARNLLQHPYFS